MAKAKKKTKKEKAKAREEARITTGMTPDEVMALINKTAKKRVLSVSSIRYVKTPTVSMKCVEMEHTRKNGTNEGWSK